MAAYPARFIDLEQRPEQTRSLRHSDLSLRTTASSLAEPEVAIQQASHKLLPNMPTTAPGRQSRNLMGLLKYIFQVLGDEAVYLGLWF